MDIIYPFLTYLIGYFFPSQDVDGHSIATKNRLHTAAHFILQDAFDDPYYCFLDEDDPRMEDLLVGLYLEQGDEVRFLSIGNYICDKR